MRASAVFLAAAVFAVAQAAQVDDRYSCAITGSAPARPPSLSFCHKFNNLACCTPGEDATVADNFAQLTDLGLSCRLHGDVRQTPMAKLYCLTCDPDQPLYVRPEPFVPIISKSSSSGVSSLKLIDICPTKNCTDWTLPASLKVTDLVPQAKRSKTILICKQWALDSFGSSSSASTFFAAFQTCGLMTSQPCTDVNGQIIAGYDRYTCGNNMFMPNTAVNSVEEFLNLDSLGPPNLDAFGYKIVEGRACTDADFAVATSDNIVSGDDTFAANQYSKFSPNCLRTGAQIKLAGYSEYSGSTGTIDASTDEKCFASGARATPVAVLMALLAAVVVALVQWA